MARDSLVLSRAWLVSNAHKSKNLKENREDASVGKTRSGHLPCCNWCALPTNIVSVRGKPPYPRLGESLPVHGSGCLATFNQYARRNPKCKELSFASC